MRSKGSKYDIYVSCIGQSFIAAVHYKFVNKSYDVELASNMGKLILKLKNKMRIRFQEPFYLSKWADLV